MHTETIVKAAKEALKSIENDIAKLDEQRKELLKEKRKLNGLVKSYTKEAAQETTQA